MLPGDLVHRLRWMSEHDRNGLIELLQTVDHDALRTALGPAEPGHPDAIPASAAAGLTRKES